MNQTNGKKEARGVKRESVVNAADLAKLKTSKELPKDEPTVEDMLTNIKSQYSMEQLEAKADEMAQHMPEDELEQHRQIDKKYKDLKSY